MSTEPKHRLGLLNSEKTDKNFMKKETCMWQSFEKRLKFEIFVRMSIEHIWQTKREVGFSNPRAKLNGQPSHRAPYSQAQAIVDKIYCRYWKWRESSQQLLEVRMTTHHLQCIYMERKQALLHSKVAQTRTKLLTKTQVECKYGILERRNCHEIEDGVCRCRDPSLCWMTYRREAVPCRH